MRRTNDTWKATSTPLFFVGDFVVIELRNYKSYRDLQLQPFNHNAKGRDWYITHAKPPSFFVLLVVKSRLSRLNHA